METIEISKQQFNDLKYLLRAMEENCDASRLVTDVFGRLLAEMEKTSNQLTDDLE